jgi:hypothetical protein
MYISRRLANAKDDEERAKIKENYRRLSISLILCFRAIQTLDTLDLMYVPSSIVKIIEGKAKGVYLYNPITVFDYITKMSFLDDVKLSNILSFVIEMNGHLCEPFDITKDEFEDLFDLDIDELPLQDYPVKILFDNLVK